MHMVYVPENIDDTKSLLSDDGPVQSTVSHFAQALF